MSRRKHPSLIYIQVLVINLAVTMGNIWHNNCLLRFAVEVQDKRIQSGARQPCVSSRFYNKINHLRYTMTSSIRIVFMCHLVLYFTL